MAPGKSRPSPLEPAILAPHLSSLATALSAWENFSKLPFWHLAAAGGDGTPPPVFLHLRDYFVVVLSLFAFNSLRAAPPRCPSAHQRSKFVGRSRNSACNLHAASATPTGPTRAPFRSSLRIYVSLGFPVTFCGLPPANVE